MLLVDGYSFVVRRPSDSEWWRNIRTSSSLPRERDSQGGLQRPTESERESEKLSSTDRFSRSRMDARRISGRKRAEQPRGGATQLSEGCAHWMGTENGAPVHIQTRHWQKNIRHGKLSPRTRRSDYVARRLSMLGWVLRSIQAVTSGCTAAITLARPLLMSVQYDLGARQEHPIPGSSCRRTSSS